MKIYQVGGAVRDRLLGLAVKDRDWVVVGATPAEMEALGYRAVGRDFPVFLHPETHEEYALARTERKTGPGYKGFSFDADPGVTLEQDLARRDVTVNAIAEDRDGRVIDPYGGRADLESGILRHVSPAFVEDPLRVLRVARFAARFGFTVADETLALMREISESGELAALVPERIWTELEKALGTERPGRFLEVLRACGALEKIFPEIDRLFGVPQPARHHPEIDTGVHTLMVLAQAARLTDDREVRFAAMVHDLGKGTTPKDILPSHHGHEERGARLVEKLCRRMKAPNRYRDLGRLVARHHFICHRIMEIRPDTVVRKLEAMDAFRRPDRFEQFLLACEADAKGRTGYEDIAYDQAGRFRAYLQAAREVDTAAAAASGTDDIAGAIRTLRVDAVREAKRRLDGAAQGSI